MVTNYAFIKQAIKDKCSLDITYDGYNKKISPHILGYDESGEPKMFCFQYAGQSKKPLPVGGQWRCLFVSHIKNISQNDDKWHTKSADLTSNACVSKIDVMYK